MGVGRSTLQAWRDKQRVMVLPRSDGSFAYPIAQFEPPTADTGRPRPYATIGEIQRLVGDRMSAEELICVMATPQEMLARRGIMRTPFAAIAHGDGSLVLALLDHLLTSSDEGAPSALSVG